MVRLNYLTIISIVLVALFTHSITISAASANPELNSKQALTMKASNTSSIQTQVLPDQMKLSPRMSIVRDWWNQLIGWIDGFHITREELIEDKKNEIDKKKLRRQQLSYKFVCISISIIILLVIMGAIFWYLYGPTMNDPGHNPLYRIHPSEFDEIVKRIKGNSG
ncbi:hypothetical protein NEHOM01_1933 [Nematocida homosporus]|uniref:uncharacterized protein n=1 Tax=Nematocida homosporus TaxID=1912981 RepID=UPI00221F2B97|nr:uncharacterized protein NEHOM01_1933 [Nematocida homosporus]KAI5187102.1 hypothetical protein NEHOM01_1933 [Nematocida homosporus]